MATSIALQRLRRELAEIVTDKEKWKLFEFKGKPSQARSSKTDAMNARLGIAETGIQMCSRNDSLNEFDASVKGPPDSPYAGGAFALDVRIPDSYPFHPPNIKFTTKIWHPNISSQTGTICLDILKDQWAASMTLRSVLLSIQMLLAAPEPNDPQDAIVAKQYISKKPLFLETARYWAQTYASAPGERSADFDKKVAHLVEMGASRTEVVSQLSWNDWDAGKATENLFG